VTELEVRDRADNVPQAARSGIIQCTASPSTHVTNLEPVLALGVALAVGLLIGFEREQSAPDPADGRRGSYVGGARTYALVALMGAMSGLLAPSIGHIITIACLVGLLAFLAVSYADDVRNGRDRGVTSEVAFVITFLLGVLAATGGVIEPFGKRALALLSAAVIVTLILSAKPPLHSFATHVTKSDVLATLKFLIVAVVVLPLLPNQTYGPLDVLNPFKIGLMVVLIAGIGFVGYIAVRVLGPGRGLGLTGVLGGLASSTAVTLSMSARAKAEPDLSPSCALAVITASTVMIPRVFLIIAIVHQPLLRVLWVPFSVMLAIGVGTILVFYRRSQRSATGQHLELRNPFELGSALKWGLVFAVVLFLAKLASDTLGDKGTYLAGFLAGTTDVDAITLTAADLARQGLSAQVAATTIVIGISSNTLVKGVMAGVVGGWGYGRQVLMALLAVLAGGGVGIASTWL
jgi:uncharacterized membrane protein (DUF4010 family)